MMANTQICHSTLSIFGPSLLLQTLRMKLCRHCRTTLKATSFVWIPECVEAFIILKSHLMIAPVLAYPCFSPSASEFVVQTDASGVGLGAMLEQDGHVISYASCLLTSPETQYSTTQRVCSSGVCPQAISLLPVGEAF